MKVLLPFSQESQVMSSAANTKNMSHAPAVLELPSNSGMSVISVSGTEILYLQIVIY